MVTVLVTVALAAAGCTTDGPGGPPRPGRTLPAEPPVFREGVARIVPPLSARDEHYVVGAGDRVLVFGGLRERIGSPGFDAVGVRSGAAYTPRDGRWRPIAPLPFPLRPGGAVWTGHEVVVIGTECRTATLDEMDEYLICRPGVNRVVAYAPDRDRWREVPVPLPRTLRRDVSWGHGLGWTGTEAAFAPSTTLSGGRSARLRVGRLIILIDPERATVRQVAAPLVLRGRFPGEWALPCLVGRDVLVLPGLSLGAPLFPETQASPLRSAVLQPRRLRWRELEHQPRPPGGYPIGGVMALNEENATCTGRGILYLALIATADPTGGTQPPALVWEHDRRRWRTLPPPRLEPGQVSIPYLFLAGYVRDTLWLWGSDGLRVLPAGADGWLKVPMPQPPGVLAHRRNGLLILAAEAARADYDPTSEEQVPAIFLVDPDRLIDLATGPPGTATTGSLTGR